MRPFQMGGDLPWSSWPGIRSPEVYTLPGVRQWLPLQCTHTVKFLTPCYHPSVDTQGNICLDILKDKWSALGDVRTIPLSVQSLLGETNIDGPLVIEL